MTTRQPSPPPPPTAPPVATFAPLGVPQYRRMWGAFVVSNIGTFLQLTAGPWLMHELTGSPLLVSLVTTALTLPRLLLTLPAGVLADVVDRRTLMLVGYATGAGATAAMAGLAWADLLTPVLLLALTFALGVGSAIALPSVQTLVPDLVPSGLRAQAIALNSAAFNVARAVGPSLGGALVAAGLTSAAFGANAVTFLAVIGAVLSFPRQTVEDPAGRHLWRAAALGVRYVRFTRSIRVLIGIAGAFALTAVSVQTLLPSVSSVDLGLGATGFGILYGLFGTGALVAVVTRERARARLGRVMLPGAIATFGVGGIVFGLAPSPLVAGVGLTLAGAMWVWTLITLNATVQILAPRWIRGRVVSLYLLAIGVQPLGAFLVGALAEGVGPGTAVAIMSAGTLALGALAWRLDLPVLGQVEEPVAPADDWVVPPHARRVNGTPVLVRTTWEIDPADRDAFFAVLRQLRRTRLRTGAHRWSLYRDADRPHRITEFFIVADWDEHLAQHRRLDAEAAAVIRAARAFDRAGGPVTSHLAGLDILDPDAPPIEEQLLTQHEQLHAEDGSVPLQAADVHRGD